MALIDGETTLKTLIQRNGKCKLHSENFHRKTPALTGQSAIQAAIINNLWTVAFLYSHVYAEGEG